MEPMTGNSFRLEPVHFQIQMDLRTVLLEHPGDFPLDGVLLVTGTLVQFPRPQRGGPHCSRLLHLASV